ncbi:MAG: DNA ligase D [Acidimicrobiia bacterium]|nr:DNA ligase D [Acidimicrobiia bacterium]
MWRDDPAGVRPMLASTGDAPLQSAGFAYEPKYDGIRALVSVAAPSEVRVWSRLGNEKTRQYPAVAAALHDWARTLDAPVLLDGEIVALDERGTPIGFQHLQQGAKSGVALILFDVLRIGDEDLRPLPLRERRARLEALLRGLDDPRIRISQQVTGDGRALHQRADTEGWEGLIAKRLDSVYRSGKRSPDWRKLKLVRRQVCVVGGWTDPRGTRPFFGALLLGLYDERGRLEYVGHSGGGFTDAELGRVWKQLRALETKVSPFANTPKTNERPHWVKPSLVAEVKFTEWTADRKLRHPTYLGLRDDIRPERVRKEPDQLLRVPAARARSNTRRSEAAEKKRARGTALTKAAVSTLIARLDEIEAGAGDGVLELPGGERLDVSNLRKIFWPRLKLTKGDLFRHYARVAPYILPVLADRPLVMKRYPNGVDGKPFYQHRAPDKVPTGVRVERATSESDTRPHIIGGSLVTLLYTAQLASMSQDPWFSRVGSEDVIDHVAIDLDPPDGLPFARVLDVARWVRDELDALKAPGFPKTSGSGGLHVYVPMPPDTPYEAGFLFAHIVATMVAKKHPKLATVERSIKARGRRLYVDYMQNVRGKTLASAYSARANDFAGVSTPLTWDEVEDGGLTPKDFTLKSFADRLEAVGDPWAALRKAKGADLRAVMRLGQSG